MKHKIKTNIRKGFLYFFFGSERNKKRRKEEFTITERKLLAGPVAEHLMHFVMEK